MKLAVALSLAALVAVPLGCQGATLDLGTNDAAASDAPSDRPAPPPASPSCPYFVDDSEYGTLRGDTCLGVCSETVAPDRDLSKPDMLAAALTSVWTFCSGALGPAGATGMRFAPGCTFFFLGGTDGGVLGGFQTYDVVTNSAGLATGVIFHLSSGDVAATVTASLCLGRAALATEAGVIELVSEEPPGGNVAK